MGWVRRWGYEVRPTKAPGVMQLRDGRYLVHGKVTEGGRTRTVSRVVAAESVRAAQLDRLALLTASKTGPSKSRPLFAVYAVSLLERKLALGEIRSPKSHERWKTTLDLHLVPAFGRLQVDEITKLGIEAWKTKVGKRIANGKLSPRTANGWLSILRVIVRAAVDDYDLERDPTLRVRMFPTDEHATYTEEDPNSLTLEQCQAFLAAMRARFPQFYAVTLLGFVTGLRPSTLRPLRRRGPEADVLWERRELLVRRSNPLKQEIIETTKTKIRYRLGLPPAVVEVLGWHVRQLRGKRRRTDLLFPSTRSGMMAKTTLDKPFAACSKAIGLRFGLTPRGMRRTFQDLARAAGVSKDLRKAICGHSTEEMSDLYATIRPDEMAAGVGAIAGVLRVA